MCNDKTCGNGNGASVGGAGGRDTGNGTPVVTIIFANFVFVCMQL